MVVVQFNSMDCVNMLLLKHNHSIQCSELEKKIFLPILKHVDLMVETKKSNN